MCNGFLFNFKLVFMKYSWRKFYSHIDLWSLLARAEYLFFWRFPASNEHSDVYLFMFSF